ncbi:S8 family peptidase [Arthrobacter sp. B10-11]|uniref:S8 family peptidase n=1 Tax=Arthrobacter sp. B10-11 TaxID=3081160 RepID=UPI0029540835|nr:S8 family peptidase [Arthrobacter sp. B10-11]MDV8148942.1 S8 family peptidase [Arthrobacter sp. B10-11]
MAHEDTSDGIVEWATVFIPDGEKKYFLSRLDAYLETSEQPKTKHSALLDSIQSVRRATIRELWTDDPEDFPDGPGRTWWEVWLRKRDGRELERLTAYAESNGIRMGKHHLGFGDRTVALVQASAAELGTALNSLDDLAELRRPHDVASMISLDSAAEQSEWVNDLLERISLAPDNAPAACIIDTGVQVNHPLFAGSLHTDDAHAIDAAWSPDDRTGHGTEMAGLALFGDLGEMLVSTLPVVLNHKLESVKFLPDPTSASAHDKDLYGAVTARAVDRPEIQAPDRRRVFSIATTARRITSATNAKNQDPGKPTSWSAAIDAMAAGRSIDDTDPKFTYLDPDIRAPRRLFVVSAGNIRNLEPADDHLSRSDVEPVEDPAQAWNSITVGAFTNMDDMSGTHPAFTGYTPVAPRGELSPSSRTSVVFDSKKWPVKPDVVAEGGNYALSPEQTSLDTPDNLALLTTRRHHPGQGAFTTTRDTSAATAQVASIAANIMARYPNFWPETVRALVVHSAQWTGPMLANLEAENLRESRAKLLRRYGMGVPDLVRATNSAADSLTLVAQSTIRPFEHEDGKGAEGRVREMNLHDLPWPNEVLEGLGDTEVKMRVTLSYFIEPNPSNRGWTGRYQYPSHGLRFAVKRASESTDEFRKRINKRARANDEKILSSTSDSPQWFFGSNQQQSAGSLHTDIWTGTAADLASRGVLAVYPVSGWWKHNKRLNRSDPGVPYALLVSIETPGVDTDIWTPVYQQIVSTIEIEA